MDVFCRLKSFLSDKCLTLNLFNTRSTDPTTIYHQIVSTRVFLFLFTISICILLVYTCLDVQTESVTVPQPMKTAYDRLLSRYADTLECPCAKVSIHFGSFVQVAPVFHQVCSSAFVSQEWLDFAFGANATFIWPMDVRTSMSAMWQLIAAFCQSSNSTLADALAEFANTPLISSTILPEEQLQAKIQATLDLVLQTSTETLIRSITIAHRMMQANAYTTGLSINSILMTPAYSWVAIASVYPQETVYFLPGSKKPCYCLRDRSCPMPGGLYFYDAWDTFGFNNLNIIVPDQILSGIVIDCVPTQATFASSLECFYNQSCVNILLAAYARNINISILDASVSSRFLLTTTIEQLIHEIFIEHIPNKTDYNSYYRECAPISCNYIYSRRFDWIYVATTVIALVGGLNVILRLLAPYLVDLRLFLKKKLLGQTEPDRNASKILHNEFQRFLSISSLLGIQMQVRVKNLYEKVKASLLKLNLFDNYSEDPFDIQHGIMSTRLYFIMLIIGLIILTVYTSRSTQTITKTISLPSQSHYETLQQQYPHTLKCPCTVISIPYNEIIQVTPVYHQLCESDFVQPRWYESLLISWAGMSAVEFFGYASSHFRTLALFCEAANITVDVAKRRFLSTIFVTTEVITQSLFTSQVNALIDTFLDSTRTEFLYVLSLTNEVLRGNQYLSGFNKNMYLAVLSVDVFQLTSVDPFLITTSSWTGRNANNETCACVTDPACELSFGETLGRFKPPGIFYGCFITDSALKSSLLCWYNKTCLYELQLEFSSVGVTIETNISALDPTLPSRFPPTTSLQTIVNEIMVEQWNREISYSFFYQQCRPASCSFTYTQRSDLIYIITTVVGLFGGLNVVLKLISPIIIKAFIRRHNEENPSNAPRTG